MAFYTFDFVEQQKRSPLLQSPYTLYSPYDEPTLVLGLEAESNLTTDLSLASNSVTAFGSPTYEATGLNGGPAVSFDGVDDRMEAVVTGIKSFTELSVFFVFQGLASAPDTSTWSGHGIGVINGAGYQFGCGFTTVFAGEDALLLYGTQRLGSSVYSRAANTPEIFNTNQSTTGTQLYQNDQSITLDLSAGINTSSDTSPLNTGWTTDDILHLLASNGGSLTPTPACKVSDILVFNSVPSLALRQKIAGYLAYKRGLTSVLDAGHPYKSSPPYYNA